MNKRVRSPNYPALSLPEAVERAKSVYDKQHLHGAPREVVATSMGYNSLNGASATAISALIKYGLLEGRADDIKLSERAKRILFSDHQQEKAEALRDAALEPALFHDLSDKFPGNVPSDDVLRNHLLRIGFAQSAVSAVIRSYRETLDFVSREEGAYDSAAEVTEGAESMQTVESLKQNPAGRAGAPGASYPPPGDTIQPPAPRDDERPIGRWDFEGGGYVRITATDDIDTEEALEMVETIVGLKRRELERKRKQQAAEEPQMSVPSTAEDDDKSGEYA